jgi:hypothetical protein
LQLSLPLLLQLSLFVLGRHPERSEGSPHLAFAVAVAVVVVAVAAVVARFKSSS